MERTEIVSLAIAPLLSRLEEIRSEVTSKRETRASLLGDINALKSDFQDVANVVRELTGESPEPICPDPHATSVKGYAPGSISTVEKTQPFTPFWDMMTVRAACRTWFIRHENPPISSRELADKIGKNRGTVAATLSNMPEFIKNGNTTWQLSTAFYTAGSMTFGR